MNDVRPDETISDEERSRRLKEQLKQIRTLDLVRDMMVTLVTVGYQKLGLTGETRELRDLRDARVAIEALRRLLEVVDGEGEREEAGALRSTLASMQLAFARVAAEPQATGAPGRADAEASTRVQESAQSREEPQETEPRVKGEKPRAKAPTAASEKAPTKKAPTKKAPVKKDAVKPRSPRKPGGATPKRGEGSGRRKGGGPAAKG